MVRRAALTFVAVFSILGLASGPALADKLIVFKNGKAMKVRQVTPDGKWVKCEFEDKNFLSVPASKIQSIEDVAAGSTAGELKPTQVAAGTGGGGGFNPGPGGLGAAGLPPEVPPAPDEAVQEQSEIQQAIAEEKAARQANPQQQFGGNTGIGRRGMRVGGQQNVNPFQPGGLQPLNQPAGSIFQNRGVTQRGNNLRSNNQNGPIRPTGTNTQNQDN